MMTALRFSQYNVVESVSRRVKSPTGRDWSLSISQSLPISWERTIVSPTLYPISLLSMICTSCLPSINRTFAFSKHELHVNSITTKINNFFIFLLFCDCLSRLSYDSRDLDKTNIYMLIKVKLFYIFIV